MKSPQLPQSALLDIESLDLQAQGIAHRNGKIVFVEGALPSEQVHADIFLVKSNFEKAKTTAVVRPSASRVSARCAHFGVCGGCSMQHVDFSTQVAIKARVVEDQLWHIGRLKAETVLRPLQGFAWAYRHRARLSCHWGHRTGHLSLGFHEKLSRRVADISQCLILPPHLSNVLVPLRQMLNTLSHAKNVSHIDIAVGETMTALVLQHFGKLTDQDQTNLKQFADTHHIVWWLQTQGAPAKRFYPIDTRYLYYRLAIFDICLTFEPTDFTQVNHTMNAALVYKAVQLLDPQKNECIGDLFCGLGNFSLPLARRSNKVVGIEGSDQLVQRARDNAALNGLIHKTQFFASDLFELTAQRWQSWGVFDGLLIDPPREGAQAVCRAIIENDHADAPKRIVYISCNPATLARDAAILVGAGPYRLKMAGAVNLFPHTSHIESIAVFEYIKMQLQT